MKQMDEMNRGIRLRSEEYGFKFLTGALSVWVLYEAYVALSTGSRLQIVPTLLMTAGMMVQWISEQVMKRRMTAGEENYRQPGKVVWGILAGIAVAAVILSVGSFLLMR